MPFRADILRDDHRRRERRAWIITAVAATIILLAGLIAGAFWRWAFHDLPSLPEDPETFWSIRREASATLLDRNGDVLDVRGPLYASSITLDDLPPHVINAFIAIEDRRFYEHDGVDYRSAGRAVLANLRAGATVQGGSTLTMQLVKNLILSPERSLRRKIQEMRLALALERQLSKTQILELYLNRVYLGAGAYGVEAASRRYFGRSASQLTLSEAALLAALPKAPSRLDPTTNIEAARERAAQVLQAMTEAEFITAEERDAALAAPAQLQPAAEQTLRDGALYGYIFDEALAQAEALIASRPADLVIRTTIDPELQGMAHSALNARLDEEGERENAGQAALVALANDGSIRALVGGRNYADSQFNRAVHAYRQPGSAFKPIVYAAAFEAGLSPFTAFYDEPIDLEGWSPRNFGGNYRGRVTLQEALRRSINTVAAQVGVEIGPEAVVDMAHRLGIETELPPLPALSLGAVEVNLLELTGAYSTIASDGIRRRPFLILAVTDSRGRVLYERPETEGSGERAIEANIAQTVSTLMQDVVISGTGQNARLADRPVAGKTGTSQDSRDAWFVGFSADYTAGVWVGNDDDTPTRDVTGGGLPARIWRDFMTLAHAELPARLLSAPAPRERTEREERLAAYYSSLSSAFAAELGEAAEP
ncbi:transglycosylase domain-containing protein [Hyphobacterium marinum]|uniref:peptidoglycan glycosyltransferase n=1 Tax=Hyphobacterium marinum TaxID=3116574 RepID=A0ABU7M0L3_9PROT|nr:PBP1A family penicillin-binding protein [Hyphobacterium sp. Y6023]MEE2567339.1 PBP1A family penicillin-binding protein [Hyphobacterium sp. Y6023]